METALPRPNHTFFFYFFFTGKETSYKFLERLVEEVSLLFAAPDGVWLLLFLLVSWMSQLGSRSFSAAKDTKDFGHMQSRPPPILV